MEKPRISLWHHNASVIWSHGTSPGPISEFPAPSLRDGWMHVDIWERTKSDQLLPIKGACLLWNDFYVLIPWIEHSFGFFPCIMFMINSVPHSLIRFVVKANGLYCTISIISKAVKGELEYRNEKLQKVVSGLFLLCLIILEFISIIKLRYKFNQSMQTFILVW